MFRYFILLLVTPLLLSCEPDSSKIPKTEKDINLVSGYLGGDLPPIK